MAGWGGMKKILSILSLSLASLPLMGQVLLTGIIDGPRTGGQPKAVELYFTADVSDLSTWDLQNYNNGGTTAGGTFALSGSATAGTFMYVAAEAVEFPVFFGFAPNFTSGVLNVNGDDVVVLRNNGVVVDSIGVIGVDPDVDTAWNYLDSWLYRNNATSANANFSLADWRFPAGQSDALDALGSSGTNAAAGALAFPIGSYTPVPEPTTFAAIVAILVLALAVWRRK